MQAVEGSSRATALIVASKASGISSCDEMARAATSKASLGGAYPFE